MSQRPTFVPFEHGTTSDRVIGLRADASALDLNDEALLRQTAANHLLAVLSGLVDFNAVCPGDTAGCFLAIKILSADAAALRAAADDRRRLDLHGGGQ